MRVINLFGSVRVARIGGIPIEVHSTFLLVVLWAGWQGLRFVGGLAGALYGIATIMLLFATVLLHELGHGLQARSLDVEVEGISLLPFGGMARLDSLDDSPLNELKIAMAGPAVNLGLTIIFGSFLLIMDSFGMVPVRLRVMSFLFNPGPATVLYFLFTSNALLFSFNMLPAFPMDGGRILRAILALVMNHNRATLIAALLGRGLAILLALVGLLGAPSVGMGRNPMLVIIAVIVFIGATQENSLSKRRKALSGIVVEDAMSANRLALDPSERMTPALASRLVGYSSVVPVLDGRRLVGLITPIELSKSIGLAEPPHVSQVMRTDFPVLSMGQTLWSALELLDVHKLDAIPVVNNGILHGLLRLRDVNQALQELGRRATQSHPLPTSSSSGG